MAESPTVAKNRREVLLCQIAESKLLREQIKGLEEVRKAIKVLEKCGLYKDEVEALREKYHKALMILVDKALAL